MLAAATLLVVVLVGVVVGRGIIGGSDSTSTVDSPSIQPAPTTPVVTGPVTITRAMSYDPKGDDGAENDDLLPLLLDGTPKTQWRTVCYGDRYFGSKGGVGVVLELSGAGTGTLMINPQTKPWGVELYSAVDAVPQTLDQWGKRIAKNYGTETGPTTFVVKQPAKYLLVWLKEAGKSSMCSVKNPYQGVLAGAGFTSQPTP